MVDNRPSTVKLNQLVNKSNGSVPRDRWWPLESALLLVVLLPLVDNACRRYPLDERLPRCTFMSMSLLLEALLRAPCHWWPHCPLLVMYLLFLAS